MLLLQQAGVAGKTAVGQTADKAAQFVELLLVNARAAKLVRNPGDKTGPISHGLFHLSACLWVQCADSARAGHTTEVARTTPVLLASNTSAGSPHSFA